MVDGIVTSATSSRMLQRLISLDDELYGDGTWSRDQLEAMDAAYTTAVERAFELGLESRTAAAATYAVNGKQRADEIAIELAWRWLRENMEAGTDISFVEVVAFVGARCSGVTPARVRAGFERRFKGERRRFISPSAA